MPANGTKRTSRPTLLFVRPAMLSNDGEYRRAAGLIASAVGQERRKSSGERAIAAAVKEKGLRRLSNRTGVLITPLTKSFGGNFATYLILARQAMPA